MSLCPAFDREIDPAPHVMRRRHRSVEQL